MYNNDFLKQYTNSNMPSGALAGAGIGAVGGGGLGAFFASLAGVNPALGLLGAVPGALAGAGIVNAVQSRNNFNTRNPAFQALSTNQQESAVNDFIQAMENASGNDGSFYEWYARDPEGFKQFMLKNM